MIEKLRRALYGRRSERKERLLDQLELALDETHGERHRGRAGGREGGGREHRGQGVRPPQAVAQGPSPEHLPRERVVVPAPTSCACCGSDRLSKVGEDRDGDPGGDPAPLEGDPDGAGEVHVPGLRADLAAAGALPRDTARLGGPEPAGDDPVREVRAEPTYIQHTVIAT